MNAELPFKLVPVSPPSVGGPKGIAKAASEAAVLATPNTVEYYQIRSRSVLNRCSNPEMPFVWTINPYRGCEFGCKYCYARYTHEFMELHDGSLFERRIYAKVEAAKALLRDLTRDGTKGKPIAIGTVTDPYQPAEARFQITRSILEVLAHCRDLDLSITTKSALVVRDIDLIKQIARRNRICVNLSAITLDSRLAHRMEPRAPLPFHRFGAMRKLAEAGVEVGLFVMPILPAITDTRENLDALLQRAKESGAHFAASSVVFLQPCAQKQFYPFLQEEFPHLYQAYVRRFSRSAYTSEDYRKKVRSVFHELRAKHQLPAPPRDAIHLDDVASMKQLELF